MYIKDKTIYFNSFPENYINEKNGLKNGTTRELMGDELELFVNSELSKIVITNTETGETCWTNSNLWMNGIKERQSCEGAI